jgi:Domain of unknown function (DUF6265)
MDRRHFVTALAAASIPGGLAQADTPATPAAPVTIGLASWLVGRWTGEGLGGQLEEAWSSPVAGQMIGHFRLTREGRPVFYEFLILEEHEGGLRMRVKHFNPDMVGWEDKDKSVDFAYASATAGELAFRGLRIVRQGRRRMVMTLRMRSGGQTRDENLTFRRAGS